MRLTSRYGKRWTLVTILLLSFGLLVWQLTNKGLWADELYSLELASRSHPAEAIYDTAADVHPPLYYLLLWAWTRAAGLNDFSARFVSAAFALLAIAITYPIGHRLLGRRAAALAMLLTGVSPFLVLYSRMVRYYSLALLLGALASWLCIQRLAARRSPWYVVGYSVTAALLIYTDYPSAIVLLGHALIALSAWYRDRPAMWRIWSSLGIAILLYVPWIPVLFNQIAYISGWKPAGFSEGLFGLLFKILLPMYSFSLGETTMPWQPAGLLGATLVGLLWVVGALDLLRTKVWTSRFVLALCILPFVFIIAFSIVIIYAFPSRVLVAAPFFFLITAAGMGRIRSMRWQGVALVGILIAYGITLGNYFAGRNFINPTYAVPTRGILTYIQTNQQATDVIISESDSGLDFYLEQENSPIPHFVDFDQARGYVLTAGPHRVWILSLGRDSTRSDETPDLIHWLEQQGFHLEQQKGYIETEPIYRNLKSRALGYPAYPYRAVLRLYVRS